MRVLPRLVSFVRTLTRSSRLDADLDAELRAHVELLTDEHIGAGMPPEAARRAALLEIGGIEQVKERVRDVRIGIWIDSVWRDVRYGARMLLQNPHLTLVAILSLAIGIGLNTAVFSLLHAVFVQPLPYADPDRIVSVAQTYSADSRPFGASAANYFDWQRQNHVFDRMAVYEPTDIVLSGNSGVERLMALRVSGSNICGSR
jgi:hypothetical protein